MVQSASAKEFFKRKRDFSPFLVHLTKDAVHGGQSVDAIVILRKILDERTLKAAHYYCLFQSDLNKPENAHLHDKFKVVCFTETPIDLIDVLLIEIEERYLFRPKPYGLVFKKDFIRQHEGGPVFYTTPPLYDGLWQLFMHAKETGFSFAENKALALVNKCDEDIDFHWEREWRIVGDLEFTLSDVYCGLCPEEQIKDFETKYRDVTFIDPSWDINQILDRLVEKQKIEPCDIPF